MLRSFSLRRVLEFKLVTLMRRTYLVTLNIWILYGNVMEQLAVIWPGMDWLISKQTQALKCCANDFLARHRHCETHLTRGPQNVLCKTQKGNILLIMSNWQVQQIIVDWPCFIWFISPVNVVGWTYNQSALKHSLEIDSCKFRHMLFSFLRLELFIIVNIICFIIVGWDFRLYSRESRAWPVAKRVKPG